ncbi:MAG: UPF0280 family protein [Methanomassiliicoccaceae archaeon]|nr:UPF0280 family protein [Methanomassiliicoccaceae archaeon]
MIREHFEAGQTAVTIIAEQEYMSIAKGAVFEARSQIISKIARDPFFRTTYDPYEASEDDGHIVKRMCTASVPANVGPMAAVAGAIAEHVVQRMKDAGARYAIVDNGGDIAMICDRTVHIGLYADVGGRRLSLRIPPTDDIVGICSSSASVGPSVSFGRSDISTVISSDVALADACATALGNVIDGRNGIEGHLEMICNIDNITGCLAYCDGMLGICGDVPEIVSCEENDHIITKILFG